jgi:predicted ATPase
LRIQHRRRPSRVLGFSEAYTQAGRFDEAFAALNEALEVVDKNDDRFHEAEIHRLRGELLLAASADRGVEAEVCFQRAIDIARRHQSKAWELRATMSLARRWQRQGKRAEARQALAAVYNTFAEGWTTPDMIDASALLPV